MRITNWHLQCIYFAAVFTCVAILTMRGLVRWRERRRMGSAGDVARCGSCGYLLVAGASVRCSECGNDVRRAGLVSSRTAGLVKLGPAYVLAALAAVAAVWCGPRLAEYQPFGWEFSVAWMTWPKADPPLTPPRIIVQASGSGRYFGRECEYILVYGVHEAPRPLMPLMVRARDLTVQELAPSGNAVRDMPFEPSHVGKFLDQFGSDIRTDALQQRIMSQVRQIALGDFVRFDQFDPSTGSQINYSPGDAARLIVALTCFLVYTAILVLLVRRLSCHLHDRQQRRWSEEAERLRLASPTS